MRWAWNRCGGAALAVVGLAASAGSAHGVIIYQDIPDATLTLPNSGTASLSTGLDFLDDGSNEFMLTLDRVVDASGGRVAVTLNGTFQMAQVFVDEIASPSAATLFAAGATIGSGAPRAMNSTLYQFMSPGTGEFGNWRGPVTGFAGISIDGFLGPNYGWARVTVDFAVGSAIHSITVHDFAFEGQARTPIVAGAVPGPGGVALALMGGAFAMRRRKR